jgi:hypothetical protein
MSAIDTAIELTIAGIIVAVGFLKVVPAILSV